MKFLKQDIVDLYKLYIEYGFTFDDFKMNAVEDESTGEIKYYVTTNSDSIIKNKDVTKTFIKDYLLNEEKSSKLQILIEEAQKTNNEIKDIYNNRWKRLVANVPQLIPGALGYLALTAGLTFGATSLAGNFLTQSAFTAVAIGVPLASIIAVPAVATVRSNIISNKRTKKMIRMYTGEELNDQIFKKITAKVEKSGVFARMFNRRNAKNILKCYLKNTREESKSNVTGQKSQMNFNLLEKVFEYDKTGIFTNTIENAIKKGWLGSDAKERFSKIQNDANRDLNQFKMISGRSVERKATLDEFKKKFSAVNSLDLENENLISPEEVTLQPIIEGFQNDENELNLENPDHIDIDTLNPEQSTVENIVKPILGQSNIENVIKPMSPQSTVENVVKPMSPQSTVENIVKPAKNFNIDLNELREISNNFENYRKKDENKNEDENENKNDYENKNEKNSNQPENDILRDTIIKNSNKTNDLKNITTTIKNNINSVIYNAEDKFYKSIIKGLKIESEEIENHRNKSNFEYIVSDNDLSDNEPIVAREPDNIITNNNPSIPSTKIIPTRSIVPEILEDSDNAIINNNNGNINNYYGNVNNYYFLDKNNQVTKSIIKNCYTKEELNKLYNSDTTNSNRTIDYFENKNSLINNTEERKSRKEKEKNAKRQYLEREKNAKLEREEKDRKAREEMSRRAREEKNGAKPDRTSSKPRITNVHKNYFLVVAEKLINNSISAETLKDMESLKSYIGISNCELENIISIFDSIDDINTIKIDLNKMFASNKDEIAKAVSLEAKSKKQLIKQNVIKECFETIDKITSVKGSIEERLPGSMSIDKKYPKSLEMYNKICKSKKLKNLETKDIIEVTAADIKSLNDIYTTLNSILIDFLNHLKVNYDYEL